MSRRQELADNLAEVERRITAACRDADRDRRDVRLIVITKTYPASDVEALAGLGVTDVGENRHPEAADKFDEVEAKLRWHFVGALQTNKATAVARYADVVHSVDRLKLVTALDKGAAAASRQLECLVQVSLDVPQPAANDSSRRSGVAPEDVLAIADAIERSEHLRLGGVMAVAPLGGDPAEAFARLARVAGLVRQEHPTATKISAGMSGDLEEAVRAGATHVRIGRSVLGERASSG